MPKPTIAIAINANRTVKNVKLKSWFKNGTWIYGTGILISSVIK